MTEPPRGAAERVAYLIRLVAAGPHRFSLGELAARAELPPSTVHRLLKVLLDCGFVERGAGRAIARGANFTAPPRNSSPGSI
jgi:DNA-binding IclR family transcriptional regulator